MRKTPADSERRMTQRYTSERREILITDIVVIKYWAHTVGEMKRDTNGEKKMNSF